MREGGAGERSHDELSNTKLQDDMGSRLVISRYKFVRAQATKVFASPLPRCFLPKLEAAAAEAVVAEASSTSTSTTAAAAQAADAAAAAAEAAALAAAAAANLQAPLGCTRNCSLEL